MKIELKKYNAKIEPFGEILYFDERMVQAKILIDSPIFGTSPVLYSRILKIILQENTSIEIFFIGEDAKIFRDKFISEIFGE